MSSSTQVSTEATPGPMAILVQWDIVWQSAAENRRIVGEMLRGSPLLQGSLPAGSLVVLPELFDVGFTMDTAAALRDREATLAWLAETARTYGCSLVAGVAEPAEASVELPGGAPPRARNTAVCFDPSGRLIGRYVKRRPYNPGGEGRRYIGGSLATVWPWPGLPGRAVRPLICYDVRFPELFRNGPIDPELIVLIANFPAKRLEHWLTLLRARAIENQAYVIGSNRTGSDPHLDYPGRSVVFAPDGTLLLDAGAGPAVVGVPLDLAQQADYRTAFPVLADR